MNKKPLAIGLLVAGALGAAGYGLYQGGLRRGMEMNAAPDRASADSSAPAAAEQGEETTRRHLAAGLRAGDVDPRGGRKILYYQDPMVPGQRFDQPGKSPFMDMMLVPVYADADGDGSAVTVSPRVQQNLGLRTAEAVESTLSQQIAAVGSVAFNERDQAVVQARAGGFVERLHVRATLDRVSRGQPLVELHLPEWVAAQEEFLSVRRMQGRELEPLVDAARQRMRQVGMSEAQVALVERSGRPQTRITLYAPIDGVVTELAVREGMTVMPGAPLFRINGLATVWADAEVPESRTALLRPGATVRARFAALPGVDVAGRVQAILPGVDPATRTQKVRIELPNPGQRLVPGMFAQLLFDDPQRRPAVLVPTEAVIETGVRTVVIVAEADGRFRPVEVAAGLDSDGRTEIREGLRAGQRVVVSSQFLIDSEASLKGVEARMNDRAGSPLHSGEAKIEAIGRDTVTLSHGPIASLQWEAMTMDFRLPPGGLHGVAPGERIGFDFSLAPDGPPQLRSVRPLAAPAPAPAPVTGSTR